MVLSLRCLPEIKTARAENGAVDRNFRSVIQYKLSVTQLVALLQFEQVLHGLDAHTSARPVRLFGRIDLGAHDDIGFTHFIILSQIGTRTSAKRRLKHE